MRRFTLFFLSPGAIKKRPNFHRLAKSVRHPTEREVLPQYSLASGSRFKWQAGFAGLVDYAESARKDFPFQAKTGSNCGTLYASIYALKIVQRVIRGKQ
ncbi:hypothetical protein P0D69_37605 [Paraburkholderia sediminicola]|uniref:hypothetical protein n=1 Tax=Paraburkholderia sediminicola TaxID=458836 RepID=UPI0038B8ABC9